MDQNIVYQGPFDFSPFFKDPYGDPLTYSIAIADSSIAQVSINSSTGIAYIRPLKVGKTTITITASGEKSGVAFFTFTFSVYED
ncbi:pilus assembly protein N-terminal domain-containing protein [Brevibacillus ruminantium]|uniref:Pilus assembly protein N-terminal domain-containing protein n=1 Tax=Brevibacillus ruminantium TaxID=2950604 RepID=A0ABY4WQJ2_9BACL|nr:pilus assembly protein N-terminal domain-containing protein [Brevibacillus ruminantium]USG68140.1 pilus assembly protein N-terminal domain-containing protein [Brevibacillus ruminantium]